MLHSNRAMYITIRLIPLLVYRLPDNNGPIGPRRNNNINVLNQCVCAGGVGLFITTLNARLFTLSISARVIIKYFKFSFNSLHSVYMYIAKWI